MVLSKLQRRQFILLKPERAGFDILETKLSLKGAKKRAKELIDRTTTIVIAKPIQRIERKLKEVV